MKRGDWWGVLWGFIFAVVFFGALAVALWLHSQGAG